MRLSLLCPSKRSKILISRNLLDMDMNKTSFPESVSLVLGFSKLNFNLHLLFDLRNFLMGEKELLVCLPSMHKALHAVGSIAKAVWWWTSVSYSTGRE